MVAIRDNLQTDYEERKKKIEAKRKELGDNPTHLMQWEFIIEKLKIAITRLQSSISLNGNINKEMEGRPIEWTPPRI